MTTPYRVLVTGSRDWADRAAVWQTLTDITSTLPVDRTVVIIHGACPTGADAHAQNWAARYGIEVEQYPANWRQYGRAAGFRRNGSKGATHTAALAEAAGIKTGRWTA